LNHLISGTIEATTDFITKSLSLPKMETSTFYKEYLPEAKLKDVSEYDRIKLEELTLNSYILILGMISKISKKCGYEKVIIFIDKIDEFQLLKGKISNISEFIHEIAADTNLLQLDGIGFVFVIWLKIKKQLSSYGIRFDKFRPVDVNWIDSDITSILEKRIRYFSSGKKEPRDLFSQKSLDNVINIANKSPRDLLTICSTIYDEQSIIDISAKQISDLAVNNGIKNFVVRYDYVSYYASAEIATKIISLINRLQLLGKITFTNKDLAGSMKKGVQSASNQTREMRDYGFVHEEDYTENSEKIYRVIDPKITYLIDNGIKSID
jgi:hypothetical protein